MIASLLWTLAAIAISLVVCYVAGAIGLVLATFATLLILCKIDPKGLAS